MLGVSPLRSTRDEIQGEMENFSTIGTEDFADLSEGNLLESINFEFDDDFFVGCIDDGDVLPDLEMDPELLAEFSSLSGSEESEFNSSVTVANSKSDDDHQNIVHVSVAMRKQEEEEKAVISSDSRGDQEIVSKRDESVLVNENPSPKNKGRKSSSHSKNNPEGKRKVKVDWTPELHRRFVQAVEQLGVDKAVPSRILEIMGIDCLTRHNIASHLQKYRSHRKHLLAREAEAASWSQRRQMLTVGRGGGGKRDVVNPWLAPTMGFPPMTLPVHHFRPLHVYQPFTHVWPKHLPYPSPQPAWAPPPIAPPSDPSYWHQARHQQRAPNAPTQGTPCFPQPLTTTRFGSPTVPGIPPPHAPGIGVPAGQPPPLPLFDFHPSKESIDAAISDALTKPWLPLPLGLKAPALEGVMGELQKQGVPKIPPSCA